MKYQYTFKNKSLEDALYIIFGKECVSAELERQMPDGSSLIVLDIDETDGVENIFNLHIEFSKKDIEKTPVYDPNDWNPYPEVEPPESGEYVVTLDSGNLAFMRYRPSASDCKPGNWYPPADCEFCDSCGDDYWFVQTTVIAFQAKPEPYRKPQRDA